MMRRLFVVGAGTLLAASPAVAQLDPMSYGEAAASIGRTQVMNEAITRQNKAALTQRKRERAKATCANKHKAAENHGADDPRVKQLYKLCAQAGY